MRVSAKAKWYNMEKELYDSFYDIREDELLVRQGYFRAASRDLFKQVYPDRNAAEFRFSFCLVSTLPWPLPYCNSIYYKSCYEDTTRLSSTNRQLVEVQQKKLLASTR